jgi:hypothetical protein
MKAGIRTVRDTGPSAPGLADELSRRRQRLGLLLSERKRTLSYLRERFAAERGWHRRASELRRVAIVVGSPRGGTSVLHQVLRGAEDAVAPLGEHRSLFTLQGWNFPDASLERECVESMPVPPHTRQALIEQILHECWEEPNPEPTAEERECFAWNWALRFRLQWPELDIELEWLVGRVDDAAATLQRHAGALRGEALTATVLRALLDAGVPLDPYLYALDGQLLRSWFADLPEGGGSPAGVIVEIPPFVAFGPRKRPRIAARGTLVIKASSDAYRLPTLRTVFEDWEVRWLHLTRNPLASVNGLLDGWAHRGFWQHDLGALGWQRIGTARAPLREWCFDLFPGWLGYLDGPLVDACVEQWRYPHSRILLHLGAGPNVTRAQFEEFLIDGGCREAFVGRLARALGLSPGPRYMARARNPAIINATVAPAGGRWLRTRPELISLLTDDRVYRMAVQLGYRPREAFAWS